MRNSFPVMECRVLVFRMVALFSLLILSSLAVFSGKAVSQTSLFSEPLRGSVQEEITAALGGKQVLPNIERVDPARYYLDSGDFGRCAGDHHPWIYQREADDFRLTGRQDFRPPCR
ncbi:MAG: hypothetical protein HYU64_14715 [Armatimonadetes bacterium]|nr:hypothetical protein [Armatimonadota bacterium]